MKQINCNISGTPTDVPVVRCDNGHVYDGVFESAARVLFRLEDTDTGGATLHWDGHDARFVIPADPGAYEGGLLGLPDLVYRPTVLPLHIEDRAFVDVNGAPWIWRGATDFMLYKRHLDGEDIGPLIETRVGATVLRVFGMGPDFLNPGRYFRPVDYPDYFAGFAGFAETLADYGKYVELVVFAAAQDIMKDVGAQRQHLGLVADALRPLPNVFLELVNEWPKNGVNPSNFTKPDGVLCSQGSNLGDGAPLRPGWDYFTFHGRRAWPKVLISSADPAFCISRGLDGNGQRLGPPRPFVHDEPIGFAETPSPGRRSTDPDLARVLARDAVTHGAGATFHTTSGIVSQPWGPTESACADAFFQGLAS